LYFRISTNAPLTTKQLWIPRVKRFTKVQLAILTCRCVDQTLSGVAGRANQYRRRDEKGFYRSVVHSLSRNAYDDQGQEEVSFGCDSSSCSRRSENEHGEVRGHLLHHQPRIEVTEVACHFRQNGSKERKSPGGSQ